MFVRTLHDTAQTERRVTAATWESTRLVLSNDGVGFSFHITKMYAGSATTMHYKNHIEAVYCISGEGEIESVADGRVYPIKPGTIYVLDKHDRHVLRAATELQLACVFNPPLNGLEVHDEDGSYSLNGNPLVENA